MQSRATSPAAYIGEVNPLYKSYFTELRDTILASLPEGFKEEMSYGMIGYVVPHSIYAKGYHVNPALPLPFCNIAAQKNFIGFYHSGLYAMPDLKKWFIDAYAKKAKYKLDMGKSCVRLKRMDDIPFDLLGELMSKVGVDEWVGAYESQLAMHEKEKSKKS